MAKQGTCIYPCMWMYKGCACDPQQRFMDFLHARLDQEAASLPEDSVGMTAVQCSRELISQYTGALFTQECHPDDAGNNGFVIAMSRVMLIIAEQYDWHEDYEEAWRPAK